MGKQSSLSWFYLNASILSCLSISFFAIVVYTWRSNEPIYTFLVEQKIGAVPVALLIVSGSVLLGATVGYILSQMTKRRLHEVSAALLELERGSYLNETLFATEEEFSEIGKRITMLSRRLQEQASMLQQITNAQATWNEEMKQAVIDEERQRLARDLHDSVSQQLFAMSMMISAVNAQQDRNAEVAKKQLQLIEQMTTNAQSEMRALLLHLRPVQLEGKKLHQGIEELLLELSRKQHIQLIWQVEPLELEKGIEDHLFRIVQESLANTLRHSKAKKMELRFRTFGAYAILKIMDDGIGFDTSKQKAGAYGLQSIQERVKEIGGTFKLLSVPNKGTQLEVKVPILSKREE